MSIKHCMSKVTDLERGTAEVSNKWIGAVKIMGTRIDRIAIAIVGVMWENVSAARESSSVARGIAAQFLCKKPGPKIKLKLLTAHQAKGDCSWRSRWE